eukprot:scaffold11894_cov45-Cyclotella_meneghiniana.AAC.1
MEEQCQKILGHESPASHSSGSLPITGIFATSGINCSHVLQSAHKAGVGEHRFFVIDIDLNTMIGEDFPQLVRYEGRKLHSPRNIKHGRHTTSQYGRTSYGINLLRSMRHSVQTIAPSPMKRNKQLLIA